ncbi:hemagglutinin repeat-containing protein [Phascolarctobacterium sp.]
MLSGEKVTGTVGNDLNIESKQDSNNYKESNKSIGASIGVGSNKAVSGSASVGKIDSNYKSVTDQSGIKAGEGGFDIGVGKNTNLKGGIISSTADADKNKLSTGTLTFEDIKNEADYKANGVGAKVNKNNNADYNEKGVTPDIGMPANGEAESTTKATISEGTIEIRDKENQKQDINKLNRDTTNSLNKLGEIFDKTKIEERQELANLFGELAYNEIHKLADKNGWKDGSAEKNALHALVGGIMSELTGNGFLAGASASAINEMVQKKLSDQFAGEPDKHQWASAIIGGVVSQLASGNAQAVASTAASGTKNNAQWLDEEMKAQGNGTAEEVINEGELEAYSDYENEYLEKYGVNNFYELSSAQRQSIIQEIANQMNITFDAASFLANTKGIIDGSISLGVGVGGSINALGTTGKALVDIHIEGSRSDEIKIISEIALYMDAKDIIKVGGEYKYIYYPKTKIVRIENFIGVKTGLGVIGIENIPENYDFILETGVGGYLFSGGEIKGKINMSELYRKINKTKS